jgi:hypothetical protein
MYVLILEMLKMRFDMASILIPPIGSNLTLTSDWTFTLYHERHNSSLILALGFELDNCGYGIKAKHHINPSKIIHVFKTQNVTFLAGTILRVERYDIKRGRRVVDSLILTMQKYPIKLQQTYSSNGQKINKHRFWVTLSDMNRIECDIVSELTPLQ